MNGYDPRVVHDLLRELSDTTAAYQIAQRVQNAIAAITSTRELRHLDRVLVEVIPEATGFQRVALFTAPHKTRQSLIRIQNAYPPIVLGAVPSTSPLAPGSTLASVSVGHENDLIVPHYDVHGDYVLVPFHDNEELSAMLYVDSLIPGVDIKVALPALLHVTQIALIVRNNLALVALAHSQLLELKLLARTDALTQLPNRRVLEERLSIELARANRLEQTSFALAVLDVDNFKRINDTYGHPRGDSALRIVADVLKRNIRDTDLGARFGGDEFALILTDIEKDYAREVLGRVLSQLSEVSLGDVDLSASIGWTINHPGDTAETLMSRADAALYRAKETGRNRAVTDVA